MAKIEWEKNTVNPAKGCDGLPDPWEERLADDEPDWAELEHRNDRDDDLFADRRLDETEANYRRRLRRERPPQEDR
jgi:hypothetical protein